MPFFVLEALGRELSVILAIWSSPTMRSTGKASKTTAGETQHL